MRVTVFGEFGSSDMRAFLFGLVVGIAGTLGGLFYLGMLSLMPETAQEAAPTVEETTTGETDTQVTVEDDAMGLEEAAEELVEESVEGLEDEIADVEAAAGLDEAVEEVTEDVAEGSETLATDEEGAMGLDEAAEEIVEDVVEGATDASEAVTDEATDAAVFADQHAERRAQLGVALAILD